jgi:lipooligosaccharide transport system permease protein
MGSLLSIPKVGVRAWKVWLRDKDVFMKTYRTNFIPPILEPILYLFSLGFGLGLFVQEVEGVPYIKFIAPALLAISMMNTAFFECTYGSFVRMYYQKTFDAIIATPVSLEEVIAGELLWGATKSAINATIMLMVIVLFGLAQLPIALLVIPFSFLAGLLFSTIAMCFTSLTVSIDSLNYPIYLFITPMFLFSGTFFPFSVLPLQIQYFAKLFLPLVHVVVITRSFATGQINLTMIPSLAWIVIVSFALYALSINLMKKRLIM